MTRARLPLFAVALALVAADAAAAGAYPIPPQPLRKLAEGAEWILAGRVRGISIAKDGSGDGFAGRSVATIEISEELKGRRGAQTVEVRFDQGVICPADAVYAAGEEVLVFLRGSPGGIWTTQGRDYGKKDIADPAAREAYLARTREIVEVLAATDAEGRRAKILEWLVKCVEHLPTRWEGAYELFREGDLLSGYDPSGASFGAKDLSEAQLERLVAAFLKTPTFDRGGLCIVGLAVARRDRRVETPLRTELERLKLDRDAGYYAAQLMRGLAELRGWREGLEIAEGLNETWDVQSEARIAVLIKFLEKYEKLP